MTVRREGDAVVRDAFDPAHPGDYVAAPEVVLAVREALAGTGDKLYDPREAGVLAQYEVIAHDRTADRVDVILRHLRLEHCVAVGVRVTPMGSFPGASGYVRSILVSLEAPGVQADAGDRGAFEEYRLHSRREEEGQTVLVVGHFLRGYELQITLRVEAVPPERAYGFALDRDEVWRQHGRVVFDERQGRPK